MLQKLKQNKIINTIFYIAKIILFAITIAFLFEYLGTKFVVLFLIIITGYFVYRIYFVSDDVLYLSREQLEATLFGKPFKYYNKGEKIKMSKFVWRKNNGKPTKNK